MPKPIHAPTFADMPDDALVRQSMLVKNPRRPNAAAVLPFSASTLWRMVAAGQFPRPVKLRQRITAWQVGAVRQWLKVQGAPA